jgi:hypothetical protein
MTSTQYNDALLIYTDGKRPLWQVTAVIHFRYCQWGSGRPKPREEDIGHLETEGNRSAFVESGE